MGDENALEWMVFPAADNTFTLYEDAGDGFGYQQGEYTETKAELTFTETKAVFSVGKGKCRAQTAKFRGWSKPEKVLLNGEQVAWTYDSETHTVAVDAGQAESFTIELQGAALCHQNQDRFDKMKAMAFKLQAGMRFRNELYRVILKVLAAPEKMERFPVYIFNECTSPDEFMLAKAMMEYYFTDKK